MIESLEPFVAGEFALASDATDAHGDGGLKTPHGKTDLIG